MYGMEVSKAKLIAYLKGTREALRNGISVKLYNELGTSYRMKEI